MIQLHYKNTQLITNVGSVNLLILVDEKEERQLVVVTDKPTGAGVTAMAAAKRDRLGRRHYFNRSALYVLWQTMPEWQREAFYLVIRDLRNGQYNAFLRQRGDDESAAERHPLRASEAILLSIVADVPLYIEEHLWRTQSTPFSPQAQGMAIPANTLPLPMLKEALKRAIEDEQYETAQVLRDEINNRFPGESQDRDE